MISDKTYQDYNKRIKTLRNKGFTFKERNMMHKLERTYTNTNSRRTYMSAILTLSKLGYLDISEFNKNRLSEEIMKMQDIYEKNMKKQVLTDKQKDNWPTVKLIKDVVNKYNIDFRKLDVSKETHKLLQRHILTLLYLGKIPPLRSDYIRVFIDNCSNRYNTKDRYFIISDYKKSYSKGKEPIKIKVDNDLHSKILYLLELRKLMNVNIRPMPFLLNYNMDKAMTDVGLNRELNQMFDGKKISTTMLRRFYLSNKYPVNKTMDEMEQDAKNMGNSTDVQYIYRKKL